MTETGLTEVIPAAGGWQVKCAEHGLILAGRVYARESAARVVAGQHRSGEHGIGRPPRPKVYRFTRDQLIGALSGTEMWSLAATLSVGVPAAAGSMADAIIGALEDGESAAREGAPSG